MKVFLCDICLSRSSFFSLCISHLALCFRNVKCLTGFQHFIFSVFQSQRFSGRWFPTGQSEIFLSITIVPASTDGKLKLLLILFTFSRIIKYIHTRKNWNENFPRSQQTRKYLTTDTLWWENDKQRRTAKLGFLPFTTKAADVMHNPLQVFSHDMPASPRLISFRSCRVSCLTSKIKFSK